MFYRRLILSLLPACALITVAVAKPAAGPASDSAVIASIKSTLAARFPGTPIVSVQSSPVPGVYEVFTGENVVYSDATGDYVFVGQFVDTKTRRDLAIERLDAYSAIDFDSLPFDRAIKVVKGNGSRKIAVFADPDCPFCQQLEQQMAVLNDITIYTFLYPLDIHPDAKNKAHAIWCAPEADRPHVWQQWMVKQTAIPASTCDSDPIAELSALGKKLHVGTTPTFFLSSGRRMRGAMDAAQLAQLLDSTAAPKTAAAK